MIDKKADAVNHHSSPPNRQGFLEEMADAAVLGGNAMASSEPFGPVIGAVTGMVEEAVAMLSKEAPDEAKRNARAQKLKLSKPTTENAAEP